MNSIDFFAGGEGEEVQDRVSLYNSTGCPEIRFVDQDGLKLTEIHLPLPPKFWD